MSRNFDTIKEAMLHSGAPSKPIFLNMEAYCTKNRLTLEETFFNPDLVPQPTINVWLDDPEFVAWMTDRLSPEESRRWFHRGQPDEELMRNAVAVMSEHFVAARSGDDFRLYAIADKAKKLVKAVSASDTDFDIMRTVKDTLLAEGCVLDRHKAGKLKDLFMVYGSLDQRPLLCAQPDEDRWCLHKITVRPDPSMATPATDKFLERLNDPEAFAAWCYGVASGRYQGRQVPWIQGAGEDGKSTFMKAFATLFGPTAGSADWATMKNAPQFVASLFVDKKFVYVPDNANPYLLMTEIFKTLANPGADPVTVNHKYGKMYTTELEAHVAVLSNHAPEISGERHNVSRTLWLTIDEFTGEPDPRYGEKVRAELPGFLAYGQSCYARRCKDDYHIELNDAVKQAVADRISETNEPFEIILEKLFVLDPEGSLGRAEFRDLLKEEAHLSNQEIGHFKRWLETSHKVKCKQGSGGSRSYRGIRRSRPSDMRAKITVVGGAQKKDSARG